jgi:hypothetical protein
MFVYPDDEGCGFHRNAVFICTIRHAVATQRTANLQFSEDETTTAKVEEVTSAVPVFRQCLNF